MGPVTSRPGSDEQPSRVSFPPLTWTVIAVFALLLLGSLGTQLAVIHQQRDITRQQRELAARQLELFAPLARSTRPLVEDLDRAGLPRTSRDVGRFTRELLRADPLRALQTVADAAVTLNAEARLERLLRSSITVLGTVRSTRLVDKAARASDVVVRLDRTQTRALALLRRSTDFQRQALDLNRATLDTARQTLDTARRTEGHAASLDRKFGGELPPISR